MPYSSNQKSVVLEVGEIVGTDSIATQQPNGFGTATAFQDCGNGDCNMEADEVLNSNSNFDQFWGWSNMSVSGVFFVGGSGINDPNPPFPLLSSYTLNDGINGQEVKYDWGNNYEDDDYLSSYCIVFDFGKFIGGGDDTVAMEDFIGASYSNAAGNVLVVENRFTNNVNGGKIEQGRMLYGYPVSGVAAEYNVGLSFEIMEGESINHPHRLICRSSGKDDLGQHLANSFGGAPFGPDSTQSELVEFFNSFRWYISPYIHDTKWKYDYAGGRIQLDSSRKSIHCSYIEFDNMEFNSAQMGQTNNFGIRSSDDMFWGCEWDNDTNGYHLTMTVDSVENCAIQVLTFNREYYNELNTGSDADISFALENMGVDISMGTGGWVWQEITEPGTYEFCVPYHYNTTRDIDEAGTIQQAEGITGSWSGHARIKISSQYWGTKRFANNNIRFLKTKMLTGIDYSVESMEVSISRFEVRNSGWNFGDIEVPLFNTIYIDTPIYKYNYLDIFDRKTVPISLNFTSGNLKDPGKKTTGYSKTFELPSTPHNNIVLKNLIGECSVKDMDAISWRKARIKSDGVTVFEGYARIEKAITGRGGRYTCHILQDASAWPELLGESKLCDLSFPTHIKDYETVVNSWDKTVDEMSYVYPAISYGKWGLGTGNEADYANQPKTIDDFHPAVYLKAIVDRIFGNIGYTIESKFFNSDRVKKMIVPFTSGEDYAPTDNTMGESGDYSGTAQKTNQQALPDLPDSDSGETPTNKRYYPVLSVIAGSEFMTPGVSYATQNGYTVPFTGIYNMYYSAKISQSQSDLSEKGRWSCYFHVNGQAMTGSGYQNISAASNSTYTYGPEYLSYNGGSGYTNMTWWSFDSSGSTWDYKDFEMFNVQLNQGDKVQVSFYGRNHSLNWGNWSDIDDQFFMVYPSATNTFNPGGQVVSLGQVLGCGTKQKDLLKSLTEIFNLYWHTDSARKTIIVEPFNDFFGSGKLIDWTDKLDRESWTDKFLIDELAKKVNFSYAEDNSDRLVKSRNIEFADIYGDEVELWSLAISNQEKYRKDIRELGTKIIAPTLTLYTPSSGNGDLTWCASASSLSPKIPAMWKGDDGDDMWPWINTSQRPDREIGFKIRLLNYWGLSDEVGMWQMKDDNGNVQNHYSIPYSYTYNHQHSVDYINQYGEMATDNLAWHGMPENGESDPAYQRGLYDTYWSQYYDKINGGAVLRKCKVSLNKADIATLDFRDVIKIDATGGVPTYWTLYKVTDYKPGVDTLTQVELVEWKYEINTDFELQAPEYETNYGGLGEPDGESGSWLPSITNGTGTVTIGSTIPENPGIEKAKLVDSNMQIVYPTTSPGILNTKNNLTVNMLKNDVLLQKKGKKKFKKTDIISVNSQKGISIGSKENQIKSDGIALGKNLSATQGQVVLGELNNSNGSDVFQVGGGYYDYKLGKNVRRNVISVTKDGDFNIYGGEVVAEFKVGDLTITGDVYYTDKLGNKKKVYLERRVTGNMDE